jgi:predicted small integral membrane protein
MRVPTTIFPLSLSLAMACGVERLHAATQSDSASLPSDSSSDDETETESETGTETETGDEPELYDPLCGEWTSTLMQADRLNEVWLDGDDIIATGGRALVERAGAGEWTDYVDFALDGHIHAYHEAWGPAGDRWVLASGSMYEAVVYHYDGVSLTLHAEFPDEMVPRELVGRGPDDVWALAAPKCTNCGDVSELLHWDGQSWSSVEPAGQLLDIALTETGMWGVGRDGLIARHDGQSWTIDDAVGPVTLEHVWALDDDELWAGGKNAQFMHRSGGLWTNVELPELFFGLDIVALEGLAADRVWALDDYDGLWAYDGVAWTKLAELEDAAGLAVVDGGESLIVVGGSFRHMIWEVDTTDGNVTLLHERPNISVQTMIADDIDHMLLSSAHGQETWGFGEGVWEPAYEQFGRGFSTLLGPVDAAIGVRDSLYDPEAVWQLGEDPTPLSDPFETGRYTDAIEFQGQLWISGRKIDWAGHPVVYAFDGESWTDHSPPLEDEDVIQDLSAAGNRVFARTSGLMYFEDGVWESIPSPSEAESFGLLDIAATAPDRLWVTFFEQSYVMPELAMWDGAQWHDAVSLWPQLGEQCCWTHLQEAGNGRLWMLSSNYAQSEQLAHYDGDDWTIVDTPPHLHGWNHQGSEMAVAADGLFVYDGVYMWRYAFCMNE